MRKEKCARARREKGPVDQDEQQNLASSICLTSSPINQEPTLTSSWAYVRRIDLHNLNFSPCFLQLYMIEPVKGKELTYLLIQI